MSKKQRYIEYLKQDDKMFIQSKNSTKNLLLNIGIIIDKTRRDGDAYMLQKNGKDLCFFTATQAPEIFIDGGLKTK